MSSFVGFFATSTHIAITVLIMDSPAFFNDIVLSNTTTQYVYFSLIMGPTPLMVVMFLSNIFLLRTYGKFFTPKIDMVIEKNRQLIANVYMFYQVIITPCQNQIFCFFWGSVTFRKLLGFEQFLSLSTILAAFYISFCFFTQNISTILMTLILRAQVPKKGFFGKIPTIFEHGWIFGMPFISLFSALRFEFGEQYPTADNILFFLQILGFSIGIVVYFFEDPYYSRVNLMTIGSLFVLSLYYFSLKFVSKLLKRGSSTYLAAFLLFLPFLYIIVTAIIKQCRKNDNPASKIGKLSFKAIKGIYKDGFVDQKGTKQTKLDVYEKIGYLKEHRKHCKKNICSCKKLWDMFAEKKSLEEDLEIEEEQEEFLSHDSYSSSKGMNFESKLYPLIFLLFLP